LRHIDKKKNVQQGVCDEHVKTLCKMAREDLVKLLTKLPAKVLCDAMVMKCDGIN
jgi:hypothetical protein